MHLLFVFFVAILPLLSVDALPANTLSLLLSPLSRGHSRSATPTAASTPRFKSPFQTHRKEDRLQVSAASRNYDSSFDSKKTPPSATKSSAAVSDNKPLITRERLEQIQVQATKTIASYVNGSTTENRYFETSVGGRLIQTAFIKRDDGTLEVIVKSVTTQTVEETSHERLLSRVQGIQDRPSLRVATIDAFHDIYGHRTLIPGVEPWKDKTGYAAFMTLVLHIQDKLDITIGELKPTHVYVNAIDISIESRILSVLLGQYLEQLLGRPKVTILFWRPKSGNLAPRPILMGCPLEILDEKSPMNDLVVDVVLLETTESLAFDMQTGAVIESSYHHPSRNGEDSNVYILQLIREAERIGKGEFLVSTSLVVAMGLVDEQDELPDVLVDWDDRQTYTPTASDVVDTDKDV